MSDAELRDAERAFFADKSVANEARLLAERVRAGKLSEERLRVLAYVGYPAAVKLRGDEVKAPTEEQAWLEGLVAFGQEVCVVGAIVALPYYGRDLKRPKWFACDVIFGGEPGSEWLSLTFPFRPGHRGRIIRESARPHSQEEWLYNTTISPCRSLPCLCAEMCMREKNGARALTQDFKLTFGLHDQNAYRELCRELIRDVKSALTLWAFTCD